MLHVNCQHWHTKTPEARGGAAADFRRNPSSPVVVNTTLWTPAEFTSSALTQPVHLSVQGNGGKHFLLTLLPPVWGLQAERSSGRPCRLFGFKSFTQISLHRFLMKFRRLFRVIKFIWTPRAALTDMKLTRFVCSLCSVVAHLWPLVSQEEITWPTRRPPVPRRP